MNHTHDSQKNTLESHSEANITPAKISPLSGSHETRPCWQRWLRQVMFVPFWHNRWLTDEGKQKLNAAVTEAEIGHRGEVCLVIENTLPLSMAYHHCSRDRAIELFSHYRVWDTEENTGVLVYLNVCEHRLEIVADRGINRQVMPSMWKAMCDKALLGIQSGQPVQSMTTLLSDIGQLLRQYYYLEEDPKGNELSDELIYLR